jgi:SHS2 domain-containing protein
MERYRFLSHPADGKFRAFGTTLEEAFANAALATVSLMWDWPAVERRADIAVALEGRDAEQVLVKFLNEVLYLFETRRFLLAAVEGLKIEPAEKKPGEASGPGAGGHRLTAVLRGDFLSDRVDLHGDVKAATYNDMKIEAGAGGFVVQVVVDL